MNRFIVASIAAGALIAAVDAGCCPTKTGTCCSGSCDCQYGSSGVEIIKGLFEEFSKTHGKTYATEGEKSHRFAVFKNTLEVIDQRNQAEKMGGGSAEHGITRFADLTQMEFEEMYLDSRTTMNIRQRNATVVATPRVKTTGAVDYTGKQTTAVKDQGSCGSCWAHAAAEQIESDGMRLFGNPASKILSVQQFVSCDVDKETAQLGCKGGLQELGFDYVRDNGGIVSESDYPYSSYYGRTGQCDTTKTNYIMGVKGYEMILDSDTAVTEAGYTSYMLSTGTISIGVDATTWNTYKGGIMADCGKGTDINHSVQLTGVDTEAGYWKIRNSWSPEWGEEGSIRIKYGANTCGLVTEGGSYTDVFNI
jgi:C1A family cysteine protease